MGLLKITATVLKTAADIYTGRADALRRERDDLKEQLDVLKDKLDYQKRRSTDYYEVIAVMQVDRDRWKAMFFEQSSQHQTAQSMLEQGIETAARLAAQLLTYANVYREKDGEKPWTMPDAMQSLPKTSEAYGQRMKKLVDDAPVSPDGLSEREKIGPPTIS